MSYWIQNHPNLFKVLLPAAILGLGLSGCASHNAPPAMPPMPVEVLGAKMDFVEETSEYLGNLISRHSVSVESKYAGIIQNIYVKPGDHVQKGQPLLEIVADEERAALASNYAESQANKSAIGQAQKNYDAVLAQRKGLESSLSLNETELARYQRLRNAKAASQEEVDKYDDAVKRSQADLKANSAQLQSQQQAIQIAQQNYQKSVADVATQRVRVSERFIRAPFSGTVGEVPIKVGNYVQPLTTLLSVTQNQTLELNMELPAELAMRVKPGLTVRILDNEQTVASAPLFFIAPRISNDTQTILVKALFKNKEGVLKADQTVHAQIVWDRKPGLKVPVTAVLHTGGKDFLYFAEPDAKNPKGWVAKQHAVQLGPIQDQAYIVHSGLQVGNQIITAGIQKLMDGAPVALPSQNGLSPAGLAPAMPERK